MKKLCLIILCLISFSSLMIINSPGVVAEGEEKIYNFTLDVNPLLAQEKNEITIEWDMAKQIKELIVVTRLTNGQEEISFVYSPTDGRDNFATFLELNTTSVTLPYHYYLKFEISINKTGNFSLIFEYKVDNEWYEYENYIYTESKIVEENDYSTKNAIIVGIIITIFASIATYLILEASRKEFASSDEDEEDTIKLTKRKQE